MKRIERTFQNETSDYLFQNETSDYLKTFENLTPMTHFVLFVKDEPEQYGHLTVLMGDESRAKAAFNNSPANIRLLCEILPIQGEYGAVLKSIKHDH